MGSKYEPAIAGQHDEATTRYYTHLNSLPEKEQKAFIKAQKKSGLPVNVFFRQYEADQEAQTVADNQKQVRQAQQNRQAAVNQYQQTYTNEQNAAAKADLEAGKNHQANTVPVAPNQNGPLEGKDNRPQIAVGLNNRAPQPTAQQAEQNFSQRLNAGFANAAQTPQEPMDQLAEAELQKRSNANIKTATGLSPEQNAAQQPKLDEKQIEQRGRTLRLKAERDAMRLGQPYMPHGTGDYYRITGEDGARRYFQYDNGKAVYLDDNFDSAHNQNQIKQLDTFFGDYDKQVAEQKQQAENMDLSDKEYGKFTKQYDKFVSKLSPEERTKHEEGVAADISSEEYYRRQQTRTGKRDAAEKLANSFLTPGGAEGGKGFWGNLGEKTLGIAKTVGDIIVGTAGGPVSEAAYHHYYRGNEHNKAPPYPDYNLMTEGEIAKLWGTGSAALRPQALEGEALQKLRDSGREPVTIGGKQYNPDDVDKFHESMGFDASKTAAGGPDKQRAKPTDEHTNAIQTFVLERMKNTPGFEENLEKVPLKQRGEYMNALARTTKFTMSEIKEYTGAGNNLVDKLSKDYPDEEFTLNEYHQIINIQNADQGLYGGKDHLENIVNHVLYNQPLEFNGESFTDAEETLGLIKKLSGEHQQNQGVNTFAHRDLINPFPPEPLPEPEPKKRIEVPYELDGNRARGLYGNVPFQQNIAFRNGMERAQAMQERALYEQARGLNFKQDAFNVEQAGLELVNKYKNAPPQVMQQKLEEWKHGVLLDAKYSPNAPGLTTEQRLQRSEMLQQTFNGIEARFQQARFKVEQEQALLNTENQMKSILSKIRTGEYDPDPGAAQDDLLAGIAAVRGQLSPAQYQRMVENAVAAYSYETSARVFQELQANAGDGYIEIDPEMMAAFGKNRMAAIGKAVSYLTPKRFTGDYLPQQTVVDEENQAQAKKITEAIARLGPDLTNMVQRYNEGRLEDKKADINGLIAIGNDDAASTLSSSGAAELESLHQSGGISRDYYNKHSGMFKSENKTLWDTTTSPVIVTKMGVEFTNWTRDLDTNSGFAESPHDLVNRVANDVWQNRRGSGGGIYHLPEGTTLEKLVDMAREQYIYNLGRYKGADGTNSAELARIFSGALNNFDEIVANSNYKNEENFEDIKQAARYAATAKATSVIFSHENGGRFEKTLLNLKQSLDKTYLTSVVNLSDYSKTGRNNIAQVEKDNGKTGNSVGRSEILSYLRTISVAGLDNAGLDNNIHFNDNAAAVLRSAAAEIEKDMNIKGVKIFKAGYDQKDGKNAVVFSTNQGTFYMYSNGRDRYKIHKARL